VCIPIFFINIMELNLIICRRSSDSLGKEIENDSFGSTQERLSRPLSRRLKEKFQRRCGNVSL
jgi:hypothetical protein